MNEKEQFLNEMKPGLLELINSEDEFVEDLLSETERYINSQYLSTGGMKTIYKVEDRKTGRELAKAVLNEGVSQDIKDYFLREAKLTAILSHPNIVSIHDLGEDENGPWFTMELLKGNSLELNLESRPVIERLDIFLKVCDAVSYAHSQNIIHLDIKPENIQIGEFGEVTLCDWGLAKKVAEDDTDFEVHLINGHTLHGEIKGTPGFMAPEQISNEDKTSRTDIFALGSLLYFLTEEKVPFKGKDLEDTLIKTAKGEFTFYKTPMALQAVISKALNVAPDDRYSNVIKLKSEIENYLSGFATEAENAGFLKQFQLFYQRNKLISNVILTAVVSILLICLFFINQLSLREVKAVNARNEAVEARESAIQAKEAAEANFRLYREEQAMANMLRTRSSLDKVSDSFKNDFNYDSALKYINEEVAKDSVKSEVWGKKIKLNFIRLEMAEVLKYRDKSPGRDGVDELIAIAEKYRSESFEDVEKVVEVMNLFKNEFVPTHILLNQRNKRSKVEMAVLIKALFEMINGGNSLNFHYDEKTNSLDLSNNPKLKRLSIQGSAFEGVNFLKMLEIKKLNLSNTGQYHLIDFESFSGIEELNLTNTSFKSLNSLLKLKKLKRLTITAKKKQPAIFQQLADKGVELIEN